MTTIAVDVPAADVSFESAGQFIGTPGWIHEKRTLDSFELIFVKRGILPLRVGSRDLRIGGGDIAIIPPHTTHEGSGYLTDTLEFFWVHFQTRHWRRSDAVGGEAAPGDDAGRTMMLPLFSSQMDTDRLTIMFNQLLDIYQRSYPNPSSYCDYFTICLLYEVMSLTDRAARADNDQRERHALQKVHEWIRINAFEDLSVNQIADQFNYSPSYLSTIYKQYFGVSITTQISKIRIERAEELLLSTSMSVQQVAEASGYNDAKYFMRVFKQHTGLTPTRYRTSFTMRHYNNA
ncbi:AraC family transcriptional regulator [Bifidobacterium ramosum]|uniref:AraC family transcriptional regulator n=1 Tax=Bifidobacterium ramosum TaxID=1798158 RepID=A0A6L4WX12_9BIFI|nr:helix-turn-helix domain-containing protein [Bifidobacterium ramosum]KAB8286612.1 AraC family transcriptional regulator [Bifidobacterium ramosum]NEG72626.1 AraC family transcriptional regulator [Bifidobacterium ramosum]